MSGRTTRQAGAAVCLRKQRGMRTAGRRFSILRSAAFAAALFLVAACAGNAPSGKSSQPTGSNSVKIAMVTDIGGLGDKSFNDSANRGLLQAQAKLGASVSVLQSRAFADYEPNLSALAEQGNDLIFAIGFLMHDSLDAVAPRYPSAHFAIIDSVVDRPNVASVTFKEEESSFLAGVAAALVSKKKTVGFLGGIDSPLIEKFLAGYEAGAATANPKVRVIVKYTGSFDDVAAGKEYESLLAQEGADVVYAAAGKCGLGAIDEVRTLPAGNYVIGVDSDQDALAPGKVLTSALKHVDEAVYSLAAAAAKGKFPHGHIVLGLKQGGVGLTSMQFTKGLLPPDGAQEIEFYRRAIAAGKLTAPSTPAELAAFHPSIRYPRQR